MKMSLLRLKLDMMLTMALIIGLFVMAFTLIVGTTFGIVWGIALALGFNVFMWLVSPYMLQAMYRLREVKPEDNTWLYRTVERVAKRSGLRFMPKVFIAPFSTPNAFAFGSPIYGYGVAVTEGLLRYLDEDEVEAVIGHEIGHIKHGDMHVMMIATALPSMLYYLGRALMWSAAYRDDREENWGPLIGVLLSILAFILYLLSLRLSRLREFYADAHSALVVENGARKLQRALAKIVTHTNLKEVPNLTSARALLFSDPLQVGDVDPAVRALLEREVTLAERIMSIFSTHPRPEDRIRRLEELAKG